MTEENNIWEFGSELLEGGLLQFVIHAVLSVLIAWIIVRLIRRLIDKAAARSDKRSMTPFTYLFQILRAVIYSFALFAVLNSVKPLQGVGPALLSAGSVATVVIGLAAQTAFGNLISGFFIAVNQPFHIGDTISLPEKNISGSVVQITMRHTVLSTFENARIIIPNSVLDTAVIEDRAYGQESYMKRISLSVAYDTDIEKMKKVIWDCVLSTDGYIDLRSEEQKAEGAEPFMIRVDDFLDSGIAVSFPVVSRSFGDTFRVNAEIREKLLKAFAENGIEIPYPKVVVMQK